jgi:phasin family protein
MTKQFEQAVAAVNEGLAKTRAQAETLIAFGRGNVEALVKSGEIFTAGAQVLGRSVAESAQTQLTAGVANAKALAAAKSPKEFLDLQTTFARSSVEAAVAESTKFAGASKKLAEDVLAPLTARFKLAAETFAPRA